MPSPDPADFRARQSAFAAHIRDPERFAPPEDVASPRMAAYRELFFNNVENFIATGFPVLKLVMGEGWTALVRDFYARHRCSTPLFIQIAEEFLDYLEHERVSKAEDPPCLLELAHYEWVELALAVAESDPPPLAPDFAANPLASAIRFSEVAWPLAYQFPVHRIGPESARMARPPEPTYLLVYRDRDDRVHFMELNSPTYQLLHRLKERGEGLPVTALRQLAEQLGLSDPAPIIAFGAELLIELMERGVIGLPSDGAVTL